MVRGLRDMDWSQAQSKATPLASERKHLTGSTMSRLEGAAAETQRATEGKGPRVTKTDALTLTPPGQAPPLPLPPCPPW